MKEKTLNEKIEEWKQDILDTEDNQDKKYTDGALIAISKITDYIEEAVDKLKEEIWSGMTLTMFRDIIDKIFGELK